MCVCVVILDDIREIEVSYINNRVRQNKTVTSCDVASELPGDIVCIKLVKLVLRPFIRKYRHIKIIPCKLKPLKYYVEAAENNNNNFCLK